MNIDSLADILRPWMQVDTWHTTHPMDQERFHKTLNSAIQNFGSQISYDDFREAMESLIEELYSEHFDESFIDETIERFASNSETITSYISDTA